MAFRIISLHIVRRNLPSSSPASIKFSYGSCPKPARIKYHHHKCQNPAGISDHCSTTALSHYSQVSLPTHRTTRQHRRNELKIGKRDTYQYPYELQQSPNIDPIHVCPISPPQLPSVETGFPAGGYPSDGTPLFGVKNGVRVILGSGDVV